MNSEEFGLKEKKRETAHFYEEMRSSGRSTNTKQAYAGGSLGLTGGPDVEVRKAH